MLLQAIYACTSLMLFSNTRIYSGKKQGCSRDAHVQRCHDCHLSFCHFRFLINNWILNHTLDPQSFKQIDIFYLLFVINDICIAFVCANLHTLTEYKEYDGCYLGHYA